MKVGGRVKRMQKIKHRAGGMNNIVCMAAANIRKLQKEREGHKGWKRTNLGEKKGIWRRKKTNFEHEEASRGTVSSARGKGDEEAGICGRRKLRWYGN